MKPLLRTSLRICLAASGVGLTGWMVHHAGAEALASRLRLVWPVMPLVLLLEAAHLATEALATRTALGSDAPAIPMFAYVRAHLVGYALTNVMPAGRALAEATKAAMLAPWVGAPRAAAAATLNQAISLFATGLASIVCAVAATRLHGGSLAFGALALHAVALITAGLALRAATRSERLGRVLERLGRARPATAGFQRAARATPLLPAGSVAAFLAGRLAQALEIALLASAVGVDATPVRIAFAYGVNLLGTTAGDLVPAQLGTTDGAFALAATALGTTAASAVAIALALHAATLALSGVGFLALAMRPGHGTPVVAKTTA